MITKKFLDTRAKYVYVYDALINENHTRLFVSGRGLMKFVALPASALGLLLAVFATGSGFPAMVSAGQMPGKNSHYIQQFNKKSVRLERDLIDKVFEERWGTGVVESVVEKHASPIAENEIDEYWKERDKRYQTSHYFSSSNMNSVKQSIAKTDMDQQVPDSSEGPVHPGVPECRQLSMDRSEVRELVERAAAKYDVDGGFAAAIAWAESDFGREPNSPAGARGVMQLMPETARGLNVDDVCDPAANIDAGVRHLRDLLEAFPNPLLAAAAYNAGEAAVFEHGGVPPFRETVRYVAKVVNYQLGLVPKTRPAAERSSVSDASGGADSTDPAEPRALTFVNGVMNF